MAKTYRTTLVRRIGNALFAPALKAGLVPPYALLTVVGRTSGQPRSTPVRVLTHEGWKYVVAPYGEVDWARNARAAGEVTLRRGRGTTAYAVVEVEAAEAGPVLKAYARVEPITRPYFDARPSDPPAAFAAEAGRHPVFRLERI
ncbi:nitroreductase family deazaflavin-dependent oxidoreductase [Jiangella alkaliphila]|uniref:Deazaflavin-dependent oxidoreductase, nitroreductase family n=1 Tax=Jiangella alkaliphila TaxID=419479 RepID=A0A1H2LGN0_9ACTN|nr:nitroreductase family deazaflavin-dependent oxidoreductase [Jiangella alkaliphila]SDU80213.1 deazaflavin-dependent oxidoreductase, nitroreductase family [Jiangella alkaliphila]